jgi:putative transposase
MARAARCVVADIPLHVVQRGINRSNCFFADGDYLAYLRYLHDFSLEFGCSVHAYCLMTNHVHLLLTPRAPDACSLLMKKLGQCYVQAVNQRLCRTGTLWEGRFRSCMVSSDTYVLACYRYIELNPVRAGMVVSPELYRWSSYSANGRGQGDGLIDSHPAYEALGSEPSVRGHAYRQLCQDAPSAPLVEEIRKATRLGGVAGKVRRRRGRPGADK